MPVVLDKPEIAVKASARFFKGLGDATRLRILELLLDRERTVGELVELLDPPRLFALVRLRAGSEGGPTRLVSARGSPDREAATAGG